MIQDHTSNQMIGQMRMQFWRDAIKGIGNVLISNVLRRGGELIMSGTQGQPPRHPIALALHEVSQGARLPTYHLKRIVDARVRSLLITSALSITFRFRMQSCTPQHILRWSL
jgi:NADH dehydrogenase [ubiquinone] 1 alpha subcomplex assembly factor 6